MINILKDWGYCTQKTKNETVELTNLVSDIKGDLVECGVAQGVQLALMYSADKTKNIWGFDSFEGIPLATHPEELQPGIGKTITTKTGEHLISSGITVHSLDNVKMDLVKWGVNMDNIKLVKGWFEHTMKVNKVDKISLLRLDGDMYEATKVCLKYLYPKLQKGGVLIIDDWNLKGCRIACDEYFGDYKGLKPLKKFDIKEPMNFIKL